jgi:hypothetical protein
VNLPPKSENKPDAGSAPKAADLASWPLRAAEEARRGPGHYAILLGLWVAALGVVFLALYLEPDPRGFGTHEQLGFAPCRMLLCTGVPCPACSITTAVTLAAQGEFWRAWLTQPVGWLLAWFTPLLALWALRRHRIGDDLVLRWNGRRQPWLRVGLAFILAAWAYRATL